MIENKVQQETYKEVNNVNINSSAKTLEEFKSAILENNIAQNKSVEGYQDQNINKTTNTTLSKTPSMNEMQMATITAAAKQFMISPGLFKKKQVSRFKFAHSVDPLNAKYLQK
jgi:hypothetical protein